MHDFSKYETKSKRKSKKFGNHRPEKSKAFKVLKDQIEEIMSSSSCDDNPFDISDHKHIDHIKY